MYFKQTNILLGYSKYPEKHLYTYISHTHTHTHIYIYIYI